MKDYQFNILLGLLLMISAGQDAHNSFMAAAQIICAVASFVFLIKGILSWEK